MENNKNDITSSNKEQKDEVVFVGNNIEPTSEPSQKSKSESSVTEETKTLDEEKKNDTNTDIKSKNENTATNNNTDEDIVTFASVEKKDNKINQLKTDKTTSNNKVTINNTDSDDDQVVFAAVEHNGPKHAAPKQKKRFPVVPVVIASTAVLCVAVAGVVIALNTNKNSIQTTTDEISHLTVPSTASQTSSPSQSSTLISQESVEIEKVDTTNILFGKGVTVEGIDLSGKSLSDAYEAMEDKLKDIRDNINISINCDGKSITLTQDDFKFDTDIADVLVQAYHYSRNELASPTVQTTKNNDITDFNVTSVINKDSIKSAVKKVAKKFDVQPVNAHVSKFNPEATEKFTYVNGSNGYLVDQNTIETKINDILSQQTKTGNFSVETVETPYTVSLADIKANTKLIASHATTANNVWASNHNMELAIKSANGMEVKPGETFSFNTMTGDTTNGSLGYVESTAIVNGKYVPQYGGGICQASTTIYLCALKADMEVVERHAHQYPSSYADRGLDATVDYGNLDMKFKNTGKYSIYIATYVYDYNGDGCDEIMVEMYGAPFTDFDEVVPVGWVTSAGSSSYSAMGAKVYFKNGKEIKRVYLPEGSYDYKYDTYDSAASMIPSDPSYGPKDVSPTGKIPTIYSPGGNGSSAPLPYGTHKQTTSNNNTQSSSKPRN